MNFFVILLVWTTQSPIPVMVVDEAALTEHQCLVKAHRARSALPQFEQRLTAKGLTVRRTEALCVSQ